MAENVYDAPVKSLDGKPASLGDYRGKVLLIVNVASACGLTPQYAGLEKLYEDKRKDGLVVLGFPCNDFGAQEPGTPAEIQDFCSTKYSVQFPLFEKVSVKGDSRHPLYKKLIAAQPKAQENNPGAFRARLEGYGMKLGPESDILWNFEKFLVDRKGEVVARFAPDVAPDDPLITKQIDQQLAKAS
jgi:glutathione peroxidase